MQIMSYLLSNNPTEAIFLRIKDESDGSGNNISFEDAFKVYYERYAYLFWHNTAKETNPTLGEIRGKVVVLQDFAAKASYGLVYSSFKTQENYKLTTNWDLYDKWTAVKDQLVLANLVGQLCVAGTCIQLLPGNENKIYLNYLSGGGGAFPYFVASGKSDPATGAPLLPTGKTTPAWNSWPDFPRLDCLGSLCTIAFEGTNNLTFNWLATGQRKRVGIIMADFPGPGLITQIIALNNAAAAGF